MLTSLLLALSQMQPLSPSELREWHQRRQAEAAVITSALAGVADRDDVAAAAVLLQTVRRAAAADLGDGVTAHLRAAAAFGPVFGSASATREYLTRALGAARERLAFEPVAEAPLPVDYPPFTPVGEIALLEYPAVRLARAPMNRGSNGAFWSLFQHITGADIAMTAPVQTDYEAAEQAAEARPATMGFLYDVPERGPAGRFGTVEVSDQPGVVVLSIGQRGWTSPEEIERLAQLLRDHLAAAGAGWTAVGAMRVLEYNSPAVRGPRRFFEVQLPVQRPAAARPATE